HRARRRPQPLRLTGRRGPSSTATLAVTLGALACTLAIPLRRLNGIEVVYRGGVAFLRRDERERPIGPVSPSKVSYAPHRAHVAYVQGSPEGEMLFVDGAQVWPRHGATHVAIAPAWSSDGRSLALVDQSARGPRLVVLVELDDPAADLTWQ